MALAIDGTPVSGQTTTATLTTSAFTATGTSDIVVIMVFSEALSGSAPTVSSIVKAGGTGTVGTFSKRSSLADATNHTDLEVWWAVASTALTSITFTVTLSGAPDNSAALVFAVSGANTSTPWDANASLPKTGSGTASIPTVTAISTTNANTMLLGFAGYGSGSLTGPTTVTAGAMAGTTGTIVVQLHDAATDTEAIEDRVVSSTVSAASFAFGTTSGTSVPWLMIGDAIQQAGAAAAQTPYQPYFQQMLASKRKEFVGWRDGYDHRWRRWRRQRGLIVPDREIKRAA